jgi:hypothetical protein
LQFLISDFRFGEAAVYLFSRWSQESAIKLVDVEIPTTDGRWLILPRYAEPEAEQLIVSAGEVELATAGPAPRRGFAAAR